MLSHQSLMLCFGTGHGKERPTGACTSPLAMVDQNACPHKSVVETHFPHNTPSSASPGLETVPNHRRGPVEQSQCRTGVQVQDGDVIEFRIKKARS